MRIPRALMLLVLACLLAALAAKGGIDALLTVLPLAGLIVLLVSGRYVGEKHLLRWYGRTPARAPRRCSNPLPRPRPTRVRSVFARTALTWRGPPVGALS